MARYRVASLSLSNPLSNQVLAVLRFRAGGRGHWLAVRHAHLLNNELSMTLIWFILQTSVSPAYGAVEYSNLSLAIFAFRDEKLRLYLVDCLHPHLEQLQRVVWPHDNEIIVAPRKDYYQLLCVVKNY